MRTKLVPQLASYISESVVVENLQAFERICRRLRLNEVELEPEKLAVLAAFHEALSTAVGVENQNLRSDRQNLLQSKNAGSQRSAADAVENLRLLSFKASTEGYKRPSVRLTGQIAPLSRMIERPVSAGRQEEVKTYFSTYSPDSAW